VVNDRRQTTDKRDEGKRDGGRPPHLHERGGRKTATGTQDTRHKTQDARRRTATTPTTDDTPPTSSLVSNARGVDGGWDDDEEGAMGQGETRSWGKGFDV
jgi:hypothetical protein